MIKSSAPTRIDLAGGTLDIWPLYLFFDNPPTLNAAINLYARVELKPRRDKKLIVESRDLGVKAKFSGLNHLPDRHPLILILKLLRFYRPQTGLELVTDCQAPAGSGIGGSSALNIALNGALNRLTGRLIEALDASYGPLVGVRDQVPLPFQRYVVRAEVEQLLSALNHRLDDRKTSGYSGSTGLPHGRRCSR